MKLYKRLLQDIGVLLSYFWTLNTSAKWKRFKAHIYTGYLKRSFFSLGSGTTIDCYAANLKGLSSVKVGERSHLGKNIQLTVWNTNEANRKAPVIVIGDDCNIRENAHITAINKIHIGNHLLTGTNILITDNAHGVSEYHQLLLPPSERKLSTKGEIRIGNNVWLGNNVCILSGVSIGDGCIIAANSVVTKDIPSFCVAAGVPAKIIKQCNE